MNLQFDPIRQARLSAGFSMAEVAQAADRSLGWIYALERGLVKPGRPQAEAVARLLDKSVEELFGNEVREASP